jgi:N utilization substance protein B
MGARSEGRQSALQILFALDARKDDGDDGVELAIADFWRQTPGQLDGQAFADELVRAIMGHRTAIDEQIGQASRAWRLDRMARVDRNVLRLGTWELLQDDVPRAVVIDEAVELAKRFGGEGSGVFVNGVLDRIAEDIAGGAAPSA